MQELLKRASTSIQSTEFKDSDFVQNKNYYLTGLSQKQKEAQDNKKGIAKFRRIKFYVDNVLPRTADIVVIDAYRGMKQMIQFVIGNLYGYFMQDWNEGMKWLNETTKGSEINLPNNQWDWNVMFFDEISIDSWFEVKLMFGSKKETDEDDNAEDKEQIEQKKKLGVPLLDKLLDLGIEVILVQIKAVEYKRHCVLAEYTDVDSMTKHWLWIPIAALSKPSYQVEPAAISFLPQTLHKQFDETLSNTAIAYARQSLLKIVQEIQSKNSESLSLFRMPVPNLKLHDMISWAVWEQYGHSPVVGMLKDLSSIKIPARLGISEEKKITTGDQDMNEEQASTMIRKIFGEVVDEFSSIQLNPDKGELETSQSSASPENQSETLS